MTNVNANTLKGALLQSTLNEIEKIEQLDYSHIKASDDFKSKILSIQSAKEASPEKHYSKRIAISILAAVIVCFSIIFSVSAKVRTTIVNFFVEVYDSFAVFFIESEEGEENPTAIETAYEPSYFEENGYEQISQADGKLKNFTVWSKGEITVDLSQHIIDENKITSDAENASYEIAYIGERKVYYTIKNGTYFVKWLEYGYSFSLSCDASLEWQEIEKIVSSLQPINE